MVLPLNTLNWRYFYSVSNQSHEIVYLCVSNEQTQYTQNLRKPRKLSIIIKRFFSFRLQNEGHFFKRENLFFCSSSIFRSRNQWTYSQAYSAMDPSKPKHIFETTLMEVAWIGIGFSFYLFCIIATAIKIHKFFLSVWIVFFEIWQNFFA